jgi:hypothetical protein
MFPDEEKKKNNEVKVNNETFRGVNMNCDTPGTQHSLQTIQTAFCNKFITLYSGVLVRTAPRCVTYVLTENNLVI